MEGVRKELPDVVMVPICQHLEAVHLLGEVFDDDREHGQKFGAGSLPWGLEEEENGLIDLNDK
jgi:hypothetical protein